MSILAQSYFWSEQAAHAKLSRIMWPGGPLCPHCGAAERIGAVTGKGARAGLHFCCGCRRQVRATMGTLFEGSHVPLHKWFQACFLLTAGEHGISAHRLHLQLEVTNKTALRMVQRLEPVTIRTRPDFCAAEGGPGSWDAGGWGANDWTEAVNSALSADSSKDSHKARFPAPPTRQLLGFVEAARALRCRQDEGWFDAVLTEAGECRAGRGRTAAKARGIPIPDVRSVGIRIAAEADPGCGGGFAVAAPAGGDLDDRTDERIA